MNIQTIANISLFLLGVVCTGLSMRAFYIYILSRSDLLFVIGLAMITIAVGIFCAFVGNVHLGGNKFNTSWAWYAGTASGAFFLVWLSLVRSSKEVGVIKQWQIYATIVFAIIVSITPLLPAFFSPYIPASLNIFRTLIYVVGFIRYLFLYSSKHTRFTFLMWLGFLLIGTGFGIVTPQIFQPQLAYLAAIGPFIRIFGYSTLFAAYTVG